MSPESEASTGELFSEGPIESRVYMNCDNAAVIASGILLVLMLTRLRNCMFTAAGACTKPYKSERFMVGNPPREKTQYNPKRIGSCIKMRRKPANGCTPRSL